MQRISELELELTGCHSKIASLEEQQQSVNTVIEEHVVEKKKVYIHTYIYIYMCT